WRDARPWCGASFLFLWGRARVRRRKRLVEVFGDVADRLDADGQPDRFRRHPDLTLLFFGELAMCRRCGMARKRLRIADVDETLEQLQRVVQLHARIESAFHAKGQDAGSSPTHVLLGECMMRMILEPRIADPLNALMPLQELRDPLRVFAVPLHPQR